MPRSCRFEQSEERRPFGFDTATSFRKNPSRRFVSIEFEGQDGRGAMPAQIEWSTRGGSPVRGTELDKLCAQKHWKVKPDGTRGVSFEINTRPMNGDLVFENVEALIKAAKLVGARTPKCCGAHVHVDARDLTPEQLIRVARVWLKVEPTMFALASNRRAHNRYCAPFAEIASGIFSATARGGARAGLQTAYVRSRFWALNLCAYTAHQTIEVRLLQGTLDKRLLAGWAVMLAQLVDWAAAHTDADVEALSGEPMDILQRIVPRSAWFIRRRIHRTRVLPARRKLNFARAWESIAEGMLARDREIARRPLRFWMAVGSAAAAQEREEAARQQRVWQAVAYVARDYNEELARRIQNLAFAFSQAGEAVARVATLYEGFSSPSQPVPSTVGASAPTAREGRAA